ncbi:MAG: serine/threonine protein kinase [Myxococcaceae bacterium]|nr:serine/threonine protein kinase [Myxococcaceae bacterium]
MSLILNGRFRLLKAAAKGGTATVYLAEEVATGKHVAVKVMKKDLAEVKDMEKRFAREASVMAKIKHPNIVGLVHFEHAPEGLLLLTDWVDGERLDVLMGGKALEPKLGVSLLQQLAAALAAIHARGVIHRDLKPENIVVAKDGTLKLLDFGIARFTDVGAGQQFLTAAGQIAGTPSYVAPEQALAKACDARTDVYTFGVLAYRMLSGKLPFDAKHDLEMLTAHVKTTPTRMRAKDVDSHVIDVVMACLEKKPDDRPADGQALVDGLA